MHFRTASNALHCDRIGPVSPFFIVTFYIMSSFWIKKKKKKQCMRCNESKCAYRTVVNGFRLIFLHC